MVPIDEKQQQAGPERGYRALLFGIRRSVRYHGRRRQHFECLHKLVLFSALVLSSVTVATFAAAIGAGWPLWLKLLPPAAVSVLAGLDLVFGFIQKAWLHADLLRQFTDLERQLVVGRDEPTAALVDSVTEQRLRIEVTEPPVLRVLDTLCHNELPRAMGYARERQVKVNFLQRLCAPFFDLSEYRLYAN